MATKNLKNLITTKIIESNPYKKLNKLILKDLKYLVVRKFKNMILQKIAENH